MSSQDKTDGISVGLEAQLMGDPTLREEFEAFKQTQEERMQELAKRQGRIQKTMDKISGSYTGLNNQLAEIQRLYDDLDLDSVLGIRELDRKNMELKNRLKTVEDDVLGLLLLYENREEARSDLKRPNATGNAGKKKKQEKKKQLTADHFSHWFMKGYKEAGEDYTDFPTYNPPTPKNKFEAIKQIYINSNSKNKEEELLSWTVGFFTFILQLEGVIGTKVDLSKTYEDYLSWAKENAIGNKTAECLNTLNALLYNHAGREIPYEIIADNTAQYKNTLETILTPMFGIDIGNVIDIKWKNR